MQLPDPIALALRLTLLDLVLRPVGFGLIRLPMQALAVLTLAWPKLLLRPEPWALMTALAVTRVIADWPLADNHAYLLCYWLLAITLSRARVGAVTNLTYNARLLIGLTFAFATLWKVVLSPDYLDGTFFRVAMATDERLHAFARWAAGMGPGQLDALREHLAAGGALGTELETSRYRTTAMLATAWNVAINSALAVAFLHPRGNEALRHGLLLLYCIVTYAVATVDGFGWLLLGMGVALTRPEQRGTAGAYVAVFLLVLAYREL